MNRRVIPIAAPPSPRCFSSRDQWVGYLTEAQKHFKPNRRPFVGDIYRAEFFFCKDCDPIHRSDMEDQGRCQFEKYVAQLTTDKERAHASTA